MLSGLLRPIVLLQARRLLRRELRVGRSLADWIGFARTFHERLRAPRRLRGRFSIAPSQVDSEILALLEEIAACRARRILEIGTMNGGSLFLMARAAAADATLVSVDLPRRPGRRGYPRWKETLYLDFASEGQSVRLVRADSHSRAAVEQVRAAFEDEPLDLVFIDGDHSYEGVLRDYDLYAPLVRPGGLVALHDIVPDHGRRYGRRTTSHAGEVPRFWQELKRGHAYREIVEDPGQDGYGIGILVVEGGGAR